MDRTREGRASQSSTSAEPTHLHQRPRWPILPPTHTAAVSGSGAFAAHFSGAGTRRPRRTALPLLVVCTLWLGLAGISSPLSAQIQPIELEGIIVTGTPVPRTVGTETSFVTVLDGDRLRDLGFSRVTQALAAVPGLVMVQNGSYGSVASAFFRGAEADHVKVLMDGIEVNQPGGSFDFSGLLMSDVERIEVARGPASALYGSDAMAGVINIISRRGRGPMHAALSGRGGTYGRAEWSADLRGGGERASYALSASQLSGDGILAFNNRFRTSTVSGSFFLTPDDRTRIGVTGRWGDRVYHFPTDGSGNVVDRNAFTYGNESTLGLEATRQLTDELQVSATVHGYGWDGGSDDRPDSPSDNVGYFGFKSLDHFQRRSVDLRANLSPWTAVVFSAGLELEEEEQRSLSESLSEFGPSSSKSRNGRSNRGYYLHLTGDRSGWSGNLGGRVENNEQYGDFFTYQAGLSYNVAATGTRLRGKLGKGMKEPTFVETHATGFSMGNPELNPEVSRVWEVGVEQTMGGQGTSIALTWFDQELEDLIQYTFVPVEPTGPNYYNVAKARSRGLEVAGRWLQGPLSLSAGYTYLDTEVLDSGFDEGDGATFVEGEPLIRRPEHQLNLEATVRLPRGSLSGDVVLMGARQDRDFGSWPAVPVKLKRYTLVGLSGEFPLMEVRDGRPGLTFQFRVDNLLDEPYQQVFGFRAPGRAFLLGARLDFGG